MDFDEILNVAISATGSREILSERLPRPLSSGDLQKIKDDRFLSMISRCIFRAGFVWKVVDKKWPNFEKTFLKFNPLAVAYLSDDRLEEIATDKSIIRNFTKILATRTNAAYVIEKQYENGSFSKYIADWPEHKIVNLWFEMKRDGSRLGGMTGPMILRSMGKDTFLPTNDVISALTRYGFVKTHSNGSKRDLERVQEIFNLLKEESNLPLSQISKILALSMEERL